MSEVKKHKPVNPIRSKSPQATASDNLRCKWPQAKFRSRYSSKYKNYQRGKGRRTSNGVKLVIGMFTNRLELFQEVLKVLERKYGPVDYESPLLSFNKTDYYEEEFGKDLKRKFYSFKRLIKAEDLPKIKIFTNNLERKFSKRGKRSINLDPGYLTPAKLVLATTKDYQHRIYYGKGIYGEVTLRYKRGVFIPWEWTYPDYRTKEYIEIFNHIRKIYMEQLKNIPRGIRKPSNFIGGTLLLWGQNSGQDVIKR